MTGISQEFKPGRIFNSFDEFEKEFEKYMNETWQLFVRKNTRTVEQANAGLLNKSRLYEPSLKYVNAVYTCKRGGPKRIKTGDGTRGIQGTWKCDCPAMLKIRAKSRSSLEIAELKTEHNHAADADAYVLYPEVRKIHDPQVQQDVDTLLKAKVKPAKIRILLRGVNSGPLNSRDLANRRAKIMKREKMQERTEKKLLIDLLEEIWKEDPGAYINITKGENDVLMNLFIQTSKMRDNFRKYPLIILFDHTHKINKNRIPVALLMAMNGNGEGLVVGIAFLCGEVKENVAQILDAFIQTSGQEAIQDIKTCIIDNDMSEMSAVHEKLSHVNIQLCGFHVSDVFISKTTHEKPEVRRLLTKLRHAETEDEYQSNCLKLRKAASKTFWDYFEKNWLNFPAAWSYEDRKKSSNLGNTTKDRLVCTNGNLKAILNVDNSIEECVRGILDTIKNNDEDTFKKCRTQAIKEYYSTVSSDPVIEQILNSVSMFAAMKCIYEYHAETSKERVEFYSAKEKCSIFWIVLVVTFISALGAALYNENTLPSLWRKNGPELSNLDAPPPRMPTVDLKIEPKTNDQKYSKALQECKTLCRMMAECEPDQWAQRFSFLQQLKNLWAGSKDAILLTRIRGNEALTQDGKRVAVLEVVDDSHTVNNVVSSDVEDNSRSEEVEVHVSISEEEGGKWTIEELGTYQATSRRERAKSIPLSDIVQLQHGLWKVKSQSDSGIFYQIQVGQNSTDCLCGDMSICPHRLICSCEDRIRPCKHVYAVVYGASEHANAASSPDIAVLEGSSETKEPTKLGGFLSCVVCKLIAVGNGALCCICRKIVHVEECSVASNIHSKQRVCRQCICSDCRDERVRNHICLCCGCKQPILGQSSKVICYRCNKVIHEQGCHKIISVKERGGALLPVCTSCDFSLRRSADELLSNQMLTDKHIAGLSGMLSTKYGKNIMGLNAPLVVTYGQKIDSINHYPPVDLGSSHYVQILNTGKEHWVTAIFKKGSTAVYVLDSMRKLTLTDHLLFQIAMIARTNEEHIIIIRPPCKQQDNANDCGLFAAANAVEFCISEVIRFIDFDESKLRSHLHGIFMDATIEAFPRLSSRPKKTEEEEDVFILKVHCVCRLTESYGNMISCDDCTQWYHKVCVELDDGLQLESWICPKCLER